jgi:predicted amidohydrolase YtcJ
VIKTSDVLAYLRPEGGWVIWGEDFDSIRWDENVTPLTKKELDQGLKDYPKWKAAQDSAKEAARQAILDRIGLTADEAKLILG